LLPAPLLRVPLLLVLLLLLLLLLVPLLRGQLRAPVPRGSAASV